MDVVEVWTGQLACQLQAALRMTNEQFAARIGVAVRTVAGWHQDPEIMPRSEIQLALDTIHEEANDTVRRRFGLLARPDPGPAAAQALRVSISVVVSGDEVLLVCRRGDGALRWQFPAGIVKPGAPAESVAIQETLSETGVHCTVRRHLGSRLHPVTGATCDYFVCDYLMGEASNRDSLENVDVAWVPRAALGRFIPTDQIYPPIVAALEDA